MSTTADSAQAYLHRRQHRAEDAHDAPARAALIERLEWEAADLKRQNDGLLRFVDQLRDEHSQALDINERHFGKAIGEWEALYVDERRWRRIWTAATVAALALALLAVWCLK